MAPTSRAFPWLRGALLASGSFLIACGTAAPSTTTAGSNGNGNRAGVSAACPPASTSAAALCLCEDFHDVGRLRVSEGPSGVSFVGVNGHASFVNQAELAGDLHAYQGSHNVADLSVSGSMMSEGDVEAVGRILIGEDLGTSKDLQAVGHVTVGGELQVAGEERIVGLADIGNRGSFAGIDLPCGCDGDTFFDVENAVAAAAANNDNASVGLESSLKVVGSSDIALSTGTYYIEDAALVGSHHFTISGEVALYVAGGLKSVGAESFRLEDGATLDLFIAGALAQVGNVEMGNAADPQAFRLYVGGSDSVMLSVGRQVFYGSIYAPEATIAFVGDTHIVGSLFGKELAGVGNLEIEYGAPAEVDPPSCQPEPENPEGENPEPEGENPEPENPQPEGENPEPEGEGEGDPVID